MRKIKSGFTLVELAVVIVIIGLIAASIITGSSIIKSAKLKSIISEVNSYTTAIYIYMDAYDYLPGDHPNATSYWPTSGNGDGDNLIELTNEEYRVFQHLSLAGLISGSYSGVNEGSPRWQLGKNLPVVKSGGAYWIISDWLLHGRKGLLIELTGVCPNPAQCGGSGEDGPFLLPSDAKYLDNKIDDGLPLEGQVHSDNAFGKTQCLTGSAYRLTSKRNDCNIWFFIDK
jgi:prepilin-type N-terminal cleavage/methylation domain-containing protein